MGKPSFLSILWVIALSGVLDSTAADIKNDIRIVAAMDFGTARSGGAFSTFGLPNDVHIIGEDMQKVPTCIILRKSGTNDFKYTHFGKEAYDEYDAERQQWVRDCDVKYNGEVDCSELADAGAWDDEIYFFDRFKMALYDRDFGSMEDIEGKGEGIIKKIPAKNGELVESKIVIREALRYMKDQILERLDEAKMEKYEEPHIQWVITIPGMWSDEAKAFMKRAAFDAGIGLSGNLMFALEPEAAALFVMQHFKDEAKWQPGTKYCVVDAGGGTIDFVCHVLNEDMSAKETHHATGDKWGSTYLDKKFDEHMTEWFREDDYNRWELFKMEESAGYVHLIDQWTKSKHQIKKFDKQGETITIPASVTSYFGEDTIKEICNEKTGYKYCWTRGRLTLPKDMIESMYEQLIDPTIAHIKYLLEQPDVEGTDYLFLVGGFAQSEVLQSALKDEFEPEVRVLRPNNAGMAVLYGALRFGHNPTQISARRAKQTYGTSTCSLWTNECPEDKVETSQGLKYCCHKFSIFVRHNEVVETNRVVTKPYNPLEEDQKQMRVTLLTSSNPNPEYSDDPDVKERGSIVVPMEHNHGRDRVVKLHMTFGSTVVNATAEHEGEIYGAEIEWFDLLS